MGKTKLGVTMIAMYENMILEDFNPLIIQLEARTKGIEQQIETQVKKDMGVYKLFAERAAIKTRLQEIEKILNKVEYSSYSQKSPIAQETQNRLRKLNEPLERVREQRDNLIRQVKLSGIGADIKAVFDAVPGVLADLTKKYSKLPAIGEKDIKKLSIPVAIKEEQEEEE